MSEFALEVENLVKVYASRGKAPIRAVDGMSFRVPRGIIFGLLGPNGAGKSSLLRMLSTLTRPTEGTAKILGYEVVKKPIEVRKRISSVIQATAVELFLSVKDNLLTYARFQGLNKAVAARRADALIEEFQLGSEVDRKVQDLSGGFRRRVQVAKVFMVDTPVLFLDEFSTGMDPILKRQVMNLLRADGVKRAWRTLVLILGRDPRGRTRNAREPHLIERSRQRIRGTFGDDSEIDLAGSRARATRAGGA